MTPRHLPKSQLAKHHLADMLLQCHLVKMSEPVMLWSVEGMGAKLGEGMWHGQTLANRTKPGPSLQVETWLCLCHLLMFLLSKTA
jgi:hypothetical protein